MGQNDVESCTVDQEDLYVVNCIHCDGKVFRFSKNYLADCGEVSIICPVCGQYTNVTGNGRIQTG